MKFISTTLSVLFGLALLGLLGAGVYYAFHFIIDSLFAKLDPQLTAIATIAAATLLICTSIIASAMRWSRNHSCELTARKIAAYDYFIQIWGGLLWQEAYQDEINADDVQKLEKHLILRANPKVIQAYIALRQLEAETGLPNAKVTSQFIKVLMEMRKDLGLTNIGLNEQELLKLSGGNPGHLKEPNQQTLFGVPS
jgi:hypothetical protein